MATDASGERGCDARAVEAAQLLPPGVRTYRRRGGRIGPELTQVLEQDLGDWSMPDEPWDLRPAGDIDGWAVELGSGMGEATLAMARLEPRMAVIACDVHVRGIAATVRGAREAGLSNVRVFLGDGLAALQEYVPPGALDCIRVWFPDPWPKARHHKRRLIRESTVALMADRLRPGGTLHCATDVAEYAEVIADVLAGNPGLVPEVTGERPDWRPLTKYESAGLAADRPAQDFIYRRA